MPTRCSPLFLCLLALIGCRDEQAGPKKHRGAAPQAMAGLRTLDRLPPSLTFRSGATWADGAVQYLGSQLEPPAPRPGQAVRLTHYFQALKTPPQGYQLFVHLVEADTGAMIANADHELQGGAAPLARWPVGKIIEDVHVLTMPPGQDKVRLLLGFWAGETRLPVDDAAAQDGNNRMLGPVLDGQGPPLPEYRAPRASSPPAIDGSLDDKAWGAAPLVQLVNSFDGRPARYPTTARVTYDAQNLYVAFEGEDPDVWGTLLKHDDPIYNEEVVEVFLDANADGRTYNELQVSPNNVTFDASFVSYRSDLPTAIAWESGMRTAVKVRGTLNQAGDRDQGFTAEMQIPFASLTDVPRVPPQKGDRWRFNLYRLEHPDRKAGGEGQAFSPLFKGDFHHLPRFGWLQFD